MAITASNEDRKRIVAAFYDKVVEGLPAAREWLESSIETSAPAFGPTPTAAQLAAWVELEALLEEAQLLACKRTNAEDLWAPSIDADKLNDASYAALTEANAARQRGVEPSSSEAGTIMARFVDALAATTGRDAAALRARLCAKYDPRGARYWELVALMRGDGEGMTRFDDWRWIGEALRHHTTDA
jgi:hypothetical protein